MSVCAVHVMSTVLQLIHHQDELWSLGSCDKSISNPIVFSCKDHKILDSEDWSFLKVDGSGRKQHLIVLLLNYYQREVEQV